MPVNLIDFAGMNGDADNRRPQDAPMKQVPVLKYIHDETVGKFFRFDALDGLVHVRIEHLSGGIHALHSVARQRVPQLLADQGDALAIFLVGRVIVTVERAIKRIEHGNQVHDQALDAAPAFFAAVAFGPLPKILKIGLAADQRLQEIFLFRAEFLNFRGERRVASRRRIDRYRNRRPTR